MHIAGILLTISRKVNSERLTYQRRHTCGLHPQIRQSAIDVHNTFPGLASSSPNSLTVPREKKGKRLRQTAAWPTY